MTYEWKKVEDELPKIKDFGCSETVLVIRDCGDLTLKSYSLSSYRPASWGDARMEEKWLDQESSGYRVVAWRYLPEADHVYPNIK